MFTPKQFISAVAAAVISTLALATATCLFLMASAEGDDVHRTALFGGVVFDSTKKPGGGVEVSTGVDNPVPLIVISLVLTVFFWFFGVTYRGLTARKKALETPDEPVE